MTGIAAGNNETLDFKDLNSKALGILKELAWISYYSFCLLASLQIFFVTLGSSKEQLFYDAVRLESSGDYENAISNYKEALFLLHLPIFTATWLTCII